MSRIIIESSQLGLCPEIDACRKTPAAKRTKRRHNVHKSTHYTKGHLAQVGRISNRSLHCLPEEGEKHNHLPLHNPEREGEHIDGCISKAKLLKHQPEVWKHMCRQGRNVQNSWVLHQLKQTGGHFQCLLHTTLLFAGVCHGRQRCLLNQMACGHLCTSESPNLACREPSVSNQPLVSLSLLEPALGTKGGRNIYNCPNYISTCLHAFSTFS